MQDHQLIRCPEFVAHRGYPRHYPENTLVGLEAAVLAGARYVEFDVQLSAEGVPVLMHDGDVGRTAGVVGRATEISLAQLRALDVGERARLGDRFADTRIATVAEVAALLTTWPGVTAFVDVKPESLERFGTAFTVDQVLAALGPARPQCVFTCGEIDAIAAARGRGVTAVAWVIADIDDDTRAQALELAPPYLFCAAYRLPPEPIRLWPGPWRWVIYDVNRAQDALRLAQRGAHLIETMAIGEMLGAADRGEEAPHVA
jgi:glycerophosphoryl diester phosphodiesterase